MPKESHAGHRARLRERFRKNGFKAFSEYEILELLLTLCIPFRDVKPQAKALLKKFKTINDVFDAKLEQIAEVDGIGESAATCVEIIKEFAAYYLANRSQKAPIFESPEDLIRFWQMRLEKLPTEVFEVAFLDNANCLMVDGLQRLEEGSSNRMVIYPRKIFSLGLRLGASSMIVAHNHPSGDPNPSQKDLIFTQTLQNVGSVINIPVLDHIIISSNGYYSFRQEGFFG